jgi:hypothetical protein
LRRFPFCHHELQRFFFANPALIEVLLEIRVWNVFYISVGAAAREEKASQQSDRTGNKQDTAPIEVVIVVPEIPRILILFRGSWILFCHRLIDKAR